MKKLLALTIALLMAIGSVAALAETTLTEYAVISEELDADLISGNDTALSLINSVTTLLNEDPVANAPSIISVLQAVIPML